MNRQPVSPAMGWLSLGTVVFWIALFLITLASFGLWLALGFGIITLVFWFLGAHYMAAYVAWAVEHQKGKR
jgi:hypothetical protein